MPIKYLKIKSMEDLLDWFEKIHNDKPVEICMKNPSTGKEVYILMFYSYEELLNHIRGVN